MPNHHNQKIWLRSAQKVASMATNYQIWQHYTQMNSSNTGLRITHHIQEFKDFKCFKIESLSEDYTVLILTQFVLTLNKPIKQFCWAYI